MSAGRYDHLARLTTRNGLYEHTLGTTPRIEHGMCVDDVARALVVTSRDPDPDPALTAMSRTYLAYLLRAQVADGRMHARSDAAGRWLDAPSTGDHWGRALWAFATAATHSPDAQVAAGGVVGARRAMLARSPYPRAMAYAALGAVQLGVGGPVPAVPTTPAEPSAPPAPADLATRRLLHHARLVLLRAGTDHEWPWPYGRLTYANAVLPEAMIAVGGALHDDGLRRDGLVLLGWLEDVQTLAGHLSVVPAGGRGPGDVGPAFDQQPIEVTALAEAAATAFAATHEPRWSALVARCDAWFEGDNDGGLAMRDVVSGGGYDGLEDGSVNLNQGAESTLASLATHQRAQEQARSLAPAAP